METFFRAWGPVVGAIFKHRRNMRHRSVPSFLLLFSRNQFTALNFPSGASSILGGGKERERISAILHPSLLGGGGRGEKRELGATVIYEGRRERKVLEKEEEASPFIPSSSFSLARGKEGKNEE